MSEGSLEARLSAAPSVQAVRRALAGREERAWIVGGTVRDALLGRSPGELDDVDLAVEGSSEAAAQALSRAGGGAGFPLSASYGAWRVLAPDRSWSCDITPLVGATLDEDLRGRDFTVNAIAVPLEGGAPIDPLGGLRDLEAGVLRVVGGSDPHRSAYAADPLRPLRLARLATELGLRPDATTERLTQEAAPRVRSASPERVWAELRRLVVADRVLEGLELARRTGLVAAVLPELAALQGVEQSHFHHLDVHDHSLEVLRRQLDLERGLEEVFGELAPEVERVLAEPLGDDLDRRQGLRFGALLHDIGKPATRGVRPDGRVTFIGHDGVGADQVRGLCRRLRTSERFREFVAGLTRHHLALGFLVHQRPLGRRAVFRYLSACHPVEVEVTVLSCADRLATRGRGAERAIAAHLELARELMEAALPWRAEGPPPVPVRGDDLARELGLVPGPELGTLLERLREARYAGEIGTRGEAIALARRLRPQGGPEGPDADTLRENGRR